MTVEQISKYLWIDEHMSYKLACSGVVPSRKTAGPWRFKDEFKNTPLGREFLLVKAQKEEASAIDEIKHQVFNDLYNFFSRYYEEGDFVPHYLYSIQGQRYAIPYNGEEVKLYNRENLL